MQPGSGQEFDDQESFLFGREEFDTEGRLLVREHYFEDGSLERREKNVFNENGKVILEEVHDTLNEVEEKKEFEYTDSGVVEKHYYLDGSFDRHVLYLEDEKLTRIERFDGDNLDELEVFSYYDDGKMKEHIVYDADKEPLSRISYEYDDEGRVLLEKRFTQDRGEYEVENSYDEKGNLLIKSFFEGDDIVAEERYGFDDKGRQILREYIEGSNVVQSESTTFNEEGQPVESKVEDRARGQFARVNRIFGEQGEPEREEHFSAASGYSDQNEVFSLFFRYEYF